jgi:N-acetylmuramoyl-L-alanine amidase
MTKIFVAIGHGLTSMGIEDPGAVSAPYSEHTLARSVATAYASALVRSGVTVNLETEPDPDYVGSTLLANKWLPDFGDEIHFNAGGGSGCEILYHPSTSAINLKRAELMSLEISKALGIPNRGPRARTDLYWLNATKFPSLLPEIAFIDNDVDRSKFSNPDFSTNVGEAMARGTLAAIGMLYVPMNQPPVVNPPPVINPPSSTITKLEGDKMLVKTSIKTEASGCGWIDVNIPAGYIAVNAEAINAAPGTPGISPATPHNYDLGRANLTVGAGSGKQRVELVNSIPNSARGVFVLFEKLV